MGSEIRQHAFGRAGQESRPGEQTREASQGSKPGQQDPEVRFGIYTEGIAEKKSIRIGLKTGTHDIVSDAKFLPYTWVLW